MHKEMTGSITISDVSDGAIIGFQLEDLIHKTNYYDKNDIDNIINYRLDWRKSDAMFLKVVPDNTGTVQFMLPLNSVSFRMRIFWNDDNTSLFVSEPYEAQKTIEYTYSDTNVKTIAIIGEVGVYCVKGTILDITQFGANVKLKSLGNLVSHLNASNKTLNSCTALDVFKSSDLEVLDGYSFASIPLNKLPTDLETWDTSNVTSFKDLLAGRTDWNKNLSGWKTPHLNNVTNLFGQLTSIPFSINTWNFSNVIVGDYLFKDLNLSNVDLALLRFTQMITADYMYQNASNLIGFNLQPANNTSSLTSAIGMFKGAVLNGVTISNDFRELVYADSMFEGATLTNCNITLTLPKCVSAKDLFKSATITNCNITLVFTNVEDTSACFKYVVFDDATRLNINFGASGKVLANYMFANTNIKTINLNTITNSSSILYADYIFANTVNNISTSLFSLTGCISANGFIKNNNVFNGNVSSLKFTNCMYLDSAFDGCSSFVGTGLDGLLCTNLTDIDYIFYNCTSLNNANAGKVLNKSLVTANYAFYNCNLVPLNVSVDLPLIQYMDYTFYNCSQANINVSNCTFNNIISMKSAFEGNVLFNCSLAKFNPINVSADGLDRTFFGCTSFNGVVGKMNVPKLVLMNYTFYGCTSFNQSLTIIGEKISAFNYILQGCSSFNGSVEFYLPVCTSAQYVFAGCVAFNKSINSITIGDSAPTGINLEGFLSDCTVFNQPVNILPTDKAMNISKMLYKCAALNQDIGSLVITNTMINMSRAFYYCSAVIESNWANASKWIVTNVTTLEYTFTKTNFNAAINIWNVAKCLNYNSTFALCTKFNQSLASWNVTNGQNFDQMFYACTALSGKSFATWSITLAKSLGHIYKMFNTIGTGNTLPTGYVVT